MNEALKVLGMTEEKAISILERLIAEDEDIDFYSLDEKMSFEMAISALKEEPVPFDFELFQAGLMDMPKGMTNGEVIQALFPNISKYNNALLENHSRNILFDDKWWNAPYQKGGENKDV